MVCDRGFVMKGFPRGRWSSFRALATLWSVIILAVGIGCDALDVGYTKIGEVTRKPSLFDGKEIKIRGKVVDVLKLPLVETKFYTVKDETGELLIVTATAPPGMGAEVRVRGSIESMAIIGDKSIGLHLKETQRW